MDTRKNVDPRRARIEAGEEFRKAHKDLARLARRFNRIRSLLVAAGSRGGDMLAMTLPAFISPLRSTMEIADRDIELDIPF